MASRKLLCIADGSSEARTAVVFAAERARLTSSILVILRIIEPPDVSLLTSMGNSIHEEMRLEALEDLQALATIAKESSNIDADLQIRNGEIGEQIRALIDEDDGIRTLVLATAPARHGFGPLVTAATRGSFGFGKRAVAIMIVPDGLSDEEITLLAS
jgi:nucleotide-binding universal stress UspA family protein